MQGLPEVFSPFFLAPSCPNRQLLNQAVRGNPKKNKKTGYSQNGRRVPPTSKSRFQTWNFSKRGMGRSSKDSGQNLRLRRNTRGNYSTFRSTFNFSFGLQVSGRRAVVV